MTDNETIGLRYSKQVSTVTMVHSVLQYNTTIWYTAAPQHQSYKGTKEHLPITRD